MAYRTRSLLKSRKAQFFVLSVFIIVSILYFVSKWMAPYTIIDTSSVATMEEPFIFNNIKEKAIYAVNGSKSCEDVMYNIEEYKNFVENYARDKGYKLNFDVATPSCPPEPPLFPTVAEVKMSLKSDKVQLYSNFSMFWTP